MSGLARGFPGGGRTYPLDIQPDDTPGPSPAVAGEVHAEEGTPTMLVAPSLAPAAPPQVAVPPQAQIGHFGYDRAKRLIDLCIGTLMLIAAGPVVFVAWALVRVTSRGPGFYSQARVGRGG